MLRAQSSLHRGCRRANVAQRGRPSASGIRGYTPPDLSLKRLRTAGAAAAAAAAAAAPPAADAGAGAPQQAHAAAPAAGAAAEPTSSASLAWILQLLKPDAPLLACTVAVIMLSAASSLCLPLAIGWTFDTVGAGAASGGAVTPEARAAITALFVTLAAAAACNAINFALAGLISQRAGHRLRSQLFEVLIAREQSFFDATHKGELISRLTLDVDTMQASVASLLGGGAGGGQRGIRGLVEVVGGAALITWQAPQVGAVLLFATPLLVAMARRAVGASAKVAYAGQRASAAALDLANERVTQVQTVKLFAQEGREERAFAGKLEEVYGMASKGGLLQGTAEVAGRMVINVQTLAILLLGGLLLLQGTLSIGELLATNVLIMFVTVGLTSLAASVGDLGKALGSAQRMTEVVSQQQLAEGQAATAAATAAARAAAHASASSSGGGGGEGVGAASLWSKLQQVVKHEAMRVKVGTQLLAADAKLSAGLAVKGLGRGGLTRHQKAQLQRTSIDLLKILPLALYLLVPFSELTLPFILKFAPGVLPSTYSKGVARHQQRAAAAAAGEGVPAAAAPARTSSAATAATASAAASSGDSSPSTSTSSSSSSSSSQPCSISFEDVKFSYKGRDEAVLRGIDLTIPAGKTVALVGPSGSGKSSIAALLLRLYEPTGGRILVDGQPLGDQPADAWRRRVAAVMQEPGLMSGSIADNIRYGRPDASAEEVQAAADAAGVAAFAARLPAGLDTAVGERGSQLSGGQRQRVAIARALLTDPQVLVLDEATSALDVTSEAAVTAAVAAARQGRTCLVIAHRLSTVRDADIIAVVQEGRVVEQGTHDELLRRPDSLYRQLVQASRLTGRSAAAAGADGGSDASAAAAARASSLQRAAVAVAAPA